MNLSRARLLTFFVGRMHMVVSYLLNVLTYVTPILSQRSPLLDQMALCVYTLRSHITRRVSAKLHLLAQMIMFWVQYNSHHSALHLKSLFGVADLPVCLSRNLDNSH